MRCADIVLVYLSFQSTCFKIETPMALHWFYSGSLITLNSPCTLALLVDTAVCTVTFCSLVQVLHVWEKICRTYILPQVQAYLYSVYFQHLMSVWHSCFSNSCLTIKYLCPDGSCLFQEKTVLIHGAGGWWIMVYGLHVHLMSSQFHISMRTTIIKKEIDTNREHLLGESVDSFSRSQRFGGSMPRRAAAVLGAHSDWKAHGLSFPDMN